MRATRTRLPAWRRFAAPLLAAPLVAVALAWTGTAAAAQPGPPEPPASVSAPALAFAELQRLDHRVQSLGWRLVHGNAPFCAGAAAGIGLQLLDAFGFDDPAAVRRALNLSGPIAVAAVAAGSPAEAAGLRAGDTLAEVAGQPVASLPTVKPGDHARLTGLHDRIEASLAAHGRVDLAVERGGRVERRVIAGTPVCVTRFELLTQGGRAAADGRRVIVGRKLVTFLEEDEHLAALLAHELAHNLLAHRARLNAQGRSWGNVRTTEREADRLSVWLLANAGFDPHAALRFMARWGPPHDQGIFSSPDHDRWRKRSRLIEGELARLATARAADPAGRADWPRRFVAQQRLEQGEAPPPPLPDGRETG